MATTVAKKVGIVLASTRGVRIGPAVVEIVQKHLEASPSHESVEITVIDLAKYNLPAYNEKPAAAMVPAFAQFEYQHSKDWSAAIAPYDGYIFVSPEYNFGPPGGVKNAIDYLYNEWIGKPMLIVTYGIVGGANASDALKKTFEGMKLRVVKTRPQLIFEGGGHGPDTTGAVGTGQLGEQSRKAWEENKEIGEGFEELVEMLKDPTKKGSEGA